MGVVTAAYALGAVLAPYGFELALRYRDVSFALMFLGGVVLAAGVPAAALVAQSGAAFSSDASKAKSSALPQQWIAIIWVAYGAGVAAGLMAIAHAAGIAEAAGFAGWIAAAVVAASNLVGSLLCGWLSDRVLHRHLLVILPLVSALGLVGLAYLPVLAVILLGTIGFTYGGAIATYPAAIAKRFPGEDGPRVYGRVFTAWGVAGLLAPWFAGQVYDWGGSYAPALLIAAGLCSVSAVAARKAF